MPGRLGGSRRAAIIAIGALIAAFPVQAQRVESAPPRHPNIVVLLADDWGFSDVGAFGSEIATPHIDALAQAGMRFSNFHVAGSCSPTRAMLLTGVMNHRNGLGNMPETIPDEHRGKPGYDTVMNHRVVTMAELLKAAGYRTYLTGKWHLGSDRTRLPHARGYDRAFSLADAGADNFEQRPPLGMVDQIGGHGSFEIIALLALDEITRAALEPARVEGIEAERIGHRSRYSGGRLPRKAASASL